MHEQTVEVTTVPEMNRSKEEVSLGTETDRGFLLHNVLHTEDLGDIHFNLYVPESYDGSKPFALHMALPGWEGLYFQGVGEDLHWESMPFESSHYVEDMIVASAQLNDWGETSARQAIALTEYFLSAYNIDPTRVYLTGYSGGGETMSLVMAKRPELFAAYLHVSSQWDGAYEPVVGARTPVYLFVGESDEYYGSQPTKTAYNALRDLYLAQGLTENEIAKLLVLDVKEQKWFTERGISNQHGGGGLAARDESVMTWLFSKTRNTERTEHDEKETSSYAAGDSDGF